MAREEKRYGVTPVDDIVELEVPVIRLENRETAEAGAIRKLIPQIIEDPTSHRLEVPEHPDFEVRSHQPGIEALIEGDQIDPNLLEIQWGSETARQRQIPWGWFALIGLTLIGAVAWSLTRVKEGEVQVKQVRVASESLLEQDAKAEEEAGELVARIENATRMFFAATDVESMLAWVRHPERVRPLMERYYAEKPIVSNSFVRAKLLQPLTLDNRANFWMEALELEDGTSRNLVIEISDSGEPRIDWETLVCDQPMDWDAFATERPAGTSLDFRVYVERDNFFSHEFADASMWVCYRLTALGSDETLFGYVRTNDALVQRIDEILARTPNQRGSMILRLGIPEGLNSRRGVMIERLLSPRWLYLDPPDSST
jgi:hypothetical protein